MKYRCEYPANLTGHLIDRVFGQGKFADPYYVTRRRATAIIGIDFQPDELHFPQSMQAEFVDSGFDLFLSDLGDDYLVFVGTSRGDDMVVMSGSLLTEPTADDVAEYKRRLAARRTAYRTHVELGDLPEILEMEYYSDVWEELGEHCLSCGSCTMVCPTCYCFDVHDEVAAGGADGARGSGSWDSCLFKTHALVAGGENFRQSRASRVKFRFYHKQRGFVAEYWPPELRGVRPLRRRVPGGHRHRDRHQHDQRTSRCARTSRARRPRHRSRTLYQPSLARIARIQRMVADTHLSDVVDVSNLQRQVLHGTSTLGAPKLESARARIHDLNPQVTVEPFPERLTAANALRIFRGFEVVLDRQRQLPDPLSRQRRRLPRRNPRRVRRHLPVRGTGHRLRRARRTLLPLPLRRAAARQAWCRGARRRGCSARCRASSGASRPWRPSSCSSASATRLSGGCSSSTRSACSSANSPCSAIPPVRSAEARRRCAS